MHRDYYLEAATEKFKEALELLAGKTAKDWPEGFLNTPWRVMTSLGARLNPGEPPEMTCFEGGFPDMVIVRDIPFDALCEHHLIPYFGKAHVAYVAQGQVVGLSKIPRLVNWCAQPPSMQEGLTAKIADALFDSKLKPAGVLVTLSARHLCMEFRGARCPGASTITTAIRGNIDKIEVLRSINLHGG